MHGWAKVVVVQNAQIVDNNRSESGCVLTCKRMPFAKFALVKLELTCSSEQIMNVVPSEKMRRASPVPALRVFIRR